MAWKLVNPNITNDPSYLDPRLSDDESKISSNTTSLAEKASDNAITPESYTGTTIQKLQSAFNDAINQSRPLKLSGVYDITGGTITLTKTSGKRQPTYIFGGGTLKKTDAGFMFTTAQTDTDDFIFSNIYFLGQSGTAVKVFDNGANGNLIRITTNSCYFENIDTVFYSTSYVQTIKMNKDTCIGITNAVFDVNGAYDVVCDGVLFESSSGVFFVDRGNGGYQGAHNVRFENCCMEGCSNVKAVLSFVVIEGLKINGCYFEQNTGGSISFASNADCRNVSIENCTLLGSPVGIPMIYWGGYCWNCRGVNNYSSTLVNDFTNVLDTGYRIFIANHYYYNSQTNKDVNALPNLVYYDSVHDDIATKTLANNVISPSLFNQLITSIANGSISSYASNYSAIYNTGLSMGGLVLAIRGSDFTNSPQTTNLVDKSGNNKNGTANNFLYTTTSGSDGAGAIIFDATQNNYLSFPATDYDEMTIEYVLNVVTLPVGSNTGFLGCSTFNSSGYMFGMSSGKFYFDVQNTAQQGLSSNTTVIAGTKYVIQLRYSKIRKIMTMHVNGVFDKSVQGSTIWKTLTTNILYVGKDSQWSNRINHKMYALNIYNRYLSDTELASNFTVLNA